MVFEKIKLFLIVGEMGISTRIVPLIYLNFLSHFILFIYKIRTNC